MKLLRITYQLFIFTALAACSDGNGNLMGYSNVSGKTEAFEKATTVAISLNPIEYVQWVEDKKNGLMVEKQIGEYTFSAQFKPLEYVVLKQTKDPNIKSDVVKKEAEEMSDLQYFTFKIGVANGTEDPLKFGVNTNEDFQKRVEYFSFSLQNEIKLIDDTDSLNCVMFHFERAYGIAPYCTFVLGFEKSKTDAANKILVYNDQLLGVGPVKLMIQSENLKHIPKLITL